MTSLLTQFKPGLINAVLQVLSQGISNSWFPKVTRSTPTRFIMSTMCRPLTPFAIDLGGADHGGAHKITGKHYKGLVTLLVLLDYRGYTRAIPPTLPWLRGPISYTSLSCNRQIVSTGTWENAENLIRKRRATVICSVSS
jgi:hypothetical protein